MKQKYSSVRQCKFLLEVGGLCAFFRKEILKMTLRELSIETGIPISTLSSFELGRLNSLKFLYVYLVSCETTKQKNILIDGVDKILERNYYND